MPEETETTYTIPIYVKRNQVGTATTAGNTLVIEWEPDVSEDFKDLLRIRLAWGLKVEVLLNSDNPFFDQ